MESATTNSKQEVRRVFSSRVNEWAACYSDPEAHTLESQNLFSRQRIALEMLRTAVAPPATVLDLGCGTGEAAAKLMRLGYDVWGLDMAEPVVSHARDRHGSERFRVGDIEDVQFPDAMFDAVVCLGVIEYLDTDGHALREIRRILKPGGSAVISTPNASSPLRYMDSVVLLLERLGRPLYHIVKYRLRGKRAPAEQAPALAPHRSYYRRRWHRLLRAAGLEVEESVCHGFGWYRSRPGSLAEALSRQGKLVRIYLDRRSRALSMDRVRDSLFRCPAVNWLAAEQLVRVRAVTSTPIDRLQR